MLYDSTDGGVVLGDEVVDGYRCTESVELGELVGVEAGADPQVAVAGPRQPGHVDRLRLPVGQENYPVPATLLRWQRPQILG